MNRLSDKIAFVTGGGSGIGKAVAKAFSQEGAKVGLLELDPDAGRQAEREIREAGGEGIFIQADVTDDTSVSNAVQSLVDHFGGLNVLVNCAGGSDPRDKNVHEMDIEVWMRTVKLNLLHPFLCSRYGIPHLIAAGGGSIINFSSNKGLVGSNRPAYSATKGGIVALTRTMAAQYAEYGIRVNAIAPGGVLTERTQKRHTQASPEVMAARRRRAENYPFCEGVPEDMAGAAIFLASDESKMFTGTTLAADGGVSSYLKL